MKYNKSGFTLLEVLIVVVIISILLGITMSLGFNYVSTLKVRGDKEFMQSAHDTTTTTARTSNYYKNEKFTSITMFLTATGIVSELDTGTQVLSHEFEHATLLFSGGTAPVITIEPYSMGCSIDLGTGVDFQMISTINDDTYCFEIFADTCKLIQQGCD